MNFSISGFDCIWRQGLSRSNWKQSMEQLELHHVSSWRRQWHPTPVLLPGKSHGWKSLVGCSPWGCEELDTTEWLHSHFSLSCIGEGNGNPLQCSCLENPRGRGAWRAAVSGVAQSRTRLKWLSSSSRWALIQYDQCPYKKTVGPGRTQREGHVKTEGEDSHLRSKERGLRRRKPALPTPWSLSSSLQNCEKMFFVV